MEDNFLIVETIQVTLAAAGFSVVGAAPEHAAALRLAETHGVDLAVVDIKLAGDVSGLETARALVRRHDSRILLTTGYPDDILELTQAYALSCEVLRKPFHEAELLAAVRKCLAGTRFGGA